MKAITTRCHQRRNPELVLEAGEAHVPKTCLDHLVHTVEDMVDGGSVFRPGQTFQVGWMLTRVATSEDETRMTLHEPDLRSMPIQWMPGVTYTLRTLMLQLLTLDSGANRQSMAEMASGATWALCPVRLQLAEQPAAVP
jgi:hypothetical protein